MEPSYHFSTTLKWKIFFHLIIMRHQNTKTAAWKLSKNHWVRLFFVFFRFVREILFVTVAFDHPVTVKTHCWGLPMLPTLFQNIVDTWTKDKNSESMPIVWCRHIDQSLFRRGRGEGGGRAPNRAKLSAKLSGACFATAKLGFIHTFTLTTLSSQNF